MRPLIIANWKMNPGNSKDAFDLAKNIIRGLEDVEADAVLCPPFVYVPQLLPSLNVFIGAQDSFWEQEGPYTGQVSPLMLKNLGCSYVILGHSERKRLGETQDMVAKKIQAALKVGLIPVVCIGESIEKEMEMIFHGIGNWKLEIKNLVLVYEPEGAISTEPWAKASSPEQLEQALGIMRAVLLKKTGKEAVQKTAILYGGSVSSKNIESLMEKGIQGVLVGAASLNAQEFVRLVKNAIPR